MSELDPRTTQSKFSTTTQQAPLPERRPIIESAGLTSSGGMGVNEMSNILDPHLAGAAQYALILQTPESTQVVILRDVIETVGRTGDNTIRIHDRFLSRHHAHLVRVPNPEAEGRHTYRLFDGGRDDRTHSRNGVFVNDNEAHSYVLQPGDQIHFGPNVRAIFYPLERMGSQGLD
jgi:hypothetical protein